MRLVPYQEILSEKLKRQQSVRRLQFHASGHSVHIGKISPGCRGCFTPELSTGMQIGSQCMCQCPYCYYDPARQEHTQAEIDRMLADVFLKSLNPNWRPIIVALQSSGETLLYLDQLEKFVKIIRETEIKKGLNTYFYVYTNGILVNKENLARMKDWGVQELRFHIAASNFSEDVYKNLELAVREGFTGTVELPSLPHYRDKLLGSLPRLNDMGVKHLDLVECQVTNFNKGALNAMFPKGRIYQDFFIHFYDEGLSYDIIEETLDKGYGFSVLDCNSGVERCRHGPGKSVAFDMKSIEGMCVEWDYYQTNKIQNIPTKYSRGEVK
ncbi:MAG: radical SAM protein [Parcubacteria group bacterium]